MSVWLWRRNNGGIQTVHGGISACVISRTVILNADNMRDGVLTRCYLRLQFGLWVLSLLIRLGPIRLDCGIEIKRGWMNVNADAKLIWSHKH